ncbi:hypothetical protein ASPZODRAFT_128331 [Penicilliopsis zonata CBS 506.65]|uniref:Uncharacterized protein n=1 Tax=Penicilliopsis zonata CBS 506.65 TaxID=1073090 RepID=A0A1L9SRF7_9EURO|nr:hypothetical protein ASPZODRAFT_128331 [Penicilliopsis zonata CBS 506.65]OJJ49800.1 hypothetical protein ASPZODRAFT_128331 [Penicilliopsis zonata CBS 506.65]
MTCGIFAPTPPGSAYLLKKKNKNTPSLLVFFGVPDWPGHYCITYDIFTFGLETLIRPRLSNLRGLAEGPTVGCQISVVNRINVAPAASDTMH